MRIKKSRLFLAFSFILSVLLAVFYLRSPGIRIANMQIATAINENLMPVKVIHTFPKGTSRVFCWFQWRNAKINTKISARWFYLTNNVHILDDNFAIPLKEGSGSTSLSMPENKALPSGLYRVDLVAEKRILKSYTFRVE